MSKRPFFSIIIPTYNRVKDLKLAVTLDLAQTFQDFEIIIFDNDSTDSTAAMVKSLHNKKIRYYKNKKNIGVLRNLQKAVTYAKGKYVFLQSDDDFFLYNNALAHVYQILQKHQYGYVRMNYLTLFTDKETVFDFRINKALQKDLSIPAYQKPEEIISFIESVDSRFITGVIYKNDVPRKLKIIESHIIAWFNMIFYETKKNGAYYIHEPFILGSWSVWRTRKNNSDHPLYGLKKGALQSEEYYKEVKKILSASKYKKFLRDQIRDTYIKFFPLVTYMTGVKNLIKLSRRLLFLDSGLIYEPIFYLYFIPSLIIPKFLWGWIRRWLLKRMIKKNAILDKNIRKRLLELKKNYSL